MNLFVSKVPTPEFGQNKFGALILAAVVGSIFAAPFWIAPAFFAPKDSVFIGISAGESGVYTSQIRDVFEGNFFQSDSQLAEYKDGPSIFQILGSTFLGNLAKIFGDFKSIFVIEAFFTGFALFTVAYLLMFSFTKSFSWSVFSGLIFVAGYPIFIRLTPYSTDRVIKLFEDLFLLSKLPINPVLATLPYNSLYTLFQLTSIYLLHKSLSSKSTLNLILAGIFSGLLFYTTIYYWSIFFAGLGLLILFSLVTKSFEIFKKMFFIALISLLISIPFWIIFLKNSQLDALTTFGPIKARFVELFFSSRYILFGVLFFLISKVKTFEKEYLAITFVLGGIFCLNIQLLTGFTILPNHWPARLELLLMFFSTYFFWLFVKNFKTKFTILGFSHKHFTKLAILGTLLLFVYLISYQIKSLKNGGMNDYFLPNKQAEVYSWLNSTTTKDSVVLGLDPNYIYSLTSHTHNRIFMSYSGFSLAPLSEQIERIAISYSLLNVKKTDFTKEFEKTDWVGAHFNFLYDFHKYYYLGEPSSYPAHVFERITKTDPVRSWYVRYMPNSERQLILESFKNNSNLSLDKKLTRFKLDYILIGPYEKSLNVNIHHISQRLIKVFDNGDYSLYKVNKN